MGETIRDDRIASELAAADKNKIEDAIQQDIHLLDVNQSEEADELRRQDDGARVNLLPITAKTYQGVGVDMAGRMDDGAPSAGGSGAGSAIEEVDRAWLPCFQEVVPCLVDMYVLINHSNFFLVVLRFPPNAIRIPCLCSLSSEWRRRWWSTNDEAVVDKSRRNRTTRRNNLCSCTELWWHFSFRHVHFVALRSWQMESPLHLLVVQKTVGFRSWNAENYTHRIVGVIYAPQTSIQYNVSIHVLESSLASLSDLLRLSTAIVAASTHPPVEPGFVPTMSISLSDLDVVWWRCLTYRTLQLTAVEGTIRTSTSRFYDS